MGEIKPKFWFAAHMHVRFNTLVEHAGPVEGETTEFLSLDKPLPKR